MTDLIKDKPVQERCCFILCETLLQISQLAVSIFFISQAVGKQSKGPKCL